MRICANCGARFNPRTEQQLCSACRAKERTSPILKKIRESRRRVCPTCRSEFIPRHGAQVHCCEEHSADGRGRIRRRGPQYPQVCKGCGVEFVPKKNDRLQYCTRECHYRSRRSWNGGRSRPVNRLAVFCRDGWKCQICGISTPGELMGSYEPRAPELDHIKPRSRRGEFSCENLRCACRKCNHDRGNLEGPGDVPKQKPTNLVLFKKQGDAVKPMDSKRCRQLNLLDLLDGSHDKSA